ncbi:hypothetical protein C3943_13235 [Lysinibacillus sp. B2A1]|nr:hypothetical protein C3943_13235 [Lysinibacillus sp. B2A1]
MKKILIVILSILITLNLVIPAQTAEAIAISKVASATAKKVAKEAVVDIAVSVAEDIIFQYQMEQWLLGKYDVDEGYTPVCLDKKKGSQKSVCNKPAQMKEIKTTADKKVLSDKVEEVLDRKIGMNGFKKFLDWFVPIFLVSGAVKWIDAKLDSETDDLFDDVAKTSLEEVGYLKLLPPVPGAVDLQQNGESIGSKTLTPLEDSIINTDSGTVSFSDFQVTRGINFNSTGISESSYTMTLPTSLPLSLFGFYLQRDVTTIDTTYSTSSIEVNFGSKPIYKNDGYYTSIYGLSTSYNPYFRPYQKVFKNGQLIKSGSINNGYFFDVIDQPSTMKSILVSNVSDGTTWLKQNFNVNYTNAKYQYARITTFNGDIYDIHVASLDEPMITADSIQIKEKHTKNYATQLSHQITIFTSLETVHLPTFKPQISDFPLDLPSLAPGKTTIIAPPTSVPIKYNDVLIKPSNTSSTGWLNKQGEEVQVNEDEVVIGDVDTSLIPDKKPEPGTEPNPDDNEKPTEPNEKSCNESDDMEVNSGQCEGVPYFGSKLEFIFGNATGNKNHIERSLAMELQLNSIGIFDDAKGKKLVLDNLSNAFDDPSSIVKTQDNGRVVRETMISGPNGKLKVVSVWNKEKLVSVQLGEDVEDPEDIENSEDIEDSREYTNEGTDNDETLDNGGVLDSANFAQKTYNPNKFSDEGIKYYSSIAGRPIKNVDDLVDALRNGEIKPSQVPIDYIEREGNTLILNTRSSIALTQAGIPRNQWNAVNRTGNEMYEQMLTDQLVRNKLTSSGTPTVRPSGAK